MKRIKTCVVDAGLLLWMVVQTLQLNFDYPCPTECQCFRRNSPDLVFDVFCSLGVIDTQSNFSVFQTKYNSSLHVQCTSLLYSELYDYMFKDLTTFQGLILDGCLFSHVPRYAFSGMTSLEEVHIKNARKVEFHPDTFEDTPWLTRLSVIGSGLTKMPNLCKLYKLLDLNLTDNRIAEITNTGLFCDNSTLRSLTRITLNSNLLRKVRPNLGQTVPHLWEFGLADNQIETIDPRAFYDLMNLGWLDLSNNSIEYIPPYMLRKQSYLKLIALGHNPLRSIPSGFFGFSTKLLVVALGNTNIDESIWQELSPLQNMTELQLQNNRISRIDKDVLSLFRNLQYLDIHGNKITNLKENYFINLSELKTLNLGDNRIASIERDTFRGLSLLTTLDLRKNNISWVHNESLVYLQSMQELNMSYNSIDEMPYLLSMKNLVIVDLRYNRIDSLSPGIFEGLDELRGIALMGNNIRVIPRGVFDKPINLQILQLANNHIDNVENGALLGANNLGWLFLSNNKLQNISMIFSKLEALIHLDLSNNRIEGVIYDGLFPYSIKFLDLSRNRIKQVQLYAFYKFAELRKVDLRFNFIKKMQSLSITISPKLHGTPPVFYIAGNHFDCDCNMKWMRKRIDQIRPSFGQPIIYDLDVVLCSTGFQAGNTFLYKVDPNKMLCPYMDECIYATCQCCDFEGCFCRSVCPNRCSCYRSADHHKTNFVICTNKNVTVTPTHMPAVATKVWFDGNQIPVVRRFAFLGMNAIRTLFLNNSQIQAIENGSFVGLTKIQTIYLNNNLLQELLYGMFDGLKNVIEINLEHNQLIYIEDALFDHTPNLQKLYLAHNHLQYIPETVFLSNGMWHSLSLSGNPWSCECYFLKILIQNTFLISENITDRTAMQCFRENKNFTNTAELGTYLNVLDIDMDTLCRNSTTVYQNITRTRESVQRVTDTRQRTVLVCVVVAVVLVFSMIAFLYWQKDFIQLVLYSKFGCRIFSVPSDTDKVYDAFISYSHKDTDFVVRELVPRLEDDKHRYRLCVHYRDFPIGAPIADTIVRSVHSSRRTILVVSDNFLESEWCQYEFQTAHHNVLMDKTNRLIVILLHDIKKSSMDADLKLYLKTRTYLHYQDQWFWEKLYFSMPDNKHSRYTNNDNRQLGVLRSVSATVQDDEGYETPVSRLSSVNRHTSDSGFEKVSMDSLGEQACHIYEEIHPVVSVDSWGRDSSDCSSTDTLHKVPCVYT